ncbi:hypothetical protein QBC45DRAFT_205145 [Copromyces sp. CBS 386.78]|nr:hypothetical protein QBC45DRAFT_205145 [Copromyces sp. CBS 386.78]
MSLKRALPGMAWHGMAWGLPTLSSSSSSSLSSYTHPPTCLSLQTHNNNNMFHRFSFSLLFMIPARRRTGFFAFGFSMFGGGFVHSLLRERERERGRYRLRPSVDSLNALPSEEAAAVLLFIGDHIKFGDLIEHVSHFK